MIDDAKLIAYVAGELNARCRAEVEAALAIDPLLAARLGRHRDRQSRGLESSIAMEAAPKRRRAAGGGAAEDSAGNIVRLADRRNPPRTRAMRAFKWPRWSPVAISLGVGALGGYVLSQNTSGPVVVRADGALAARGSLAQALDREPAEATGTVRLSFRAADRYCRVFQLEARDLAGIACKQGSDWVARMTIRAPGAILPPAVLTAVGQMMVGRSLDRAGEDAARAKAWRFQAPAGSR